MSRATEVREPNGDALRKTKTQCTHLVVVIVAMEEGLLAEDHRGEHAVERPERLQWSGRSS